MSKSLPAGTQKQKHNKKCLGLASGLSQKTKIIFCLFFSINGHKFSLNEYLYQLSSMIISLLSEVSG